MALPTATYRLQFSPEFGFADAERLVPYLARLGISHLYASPLLGSRRGSEHGYDVTDPSRVDPELGGDEGLERLLEVLRGHGLRLLLDIVPNHMAAGAQNPWWVETLALGPEALHARAFDIDWSRGKLVLPVLGKSLSESLDEGDLTFEFGRGLFWWRHYEQRFPLSPETMHRLVRDRLGVLRPPLAAASPGDEDMASLEGYLDSGVWLRDETMTRRWHALRRVFGTAYDANESVRAAVGDLVAEVSAYTSDSGARQRVDELLAQEWYALTFWRKGLQELNYRRFFDIAGLAAVRVNEPEVFEWMHGHVLHLIREGIVDGLRIDHVDGLADPTQYLQRLAKEVQAAQGRERPYLVVEKILSGDEPVPETWPVAGTTGYEFMNHVNAVLIHGEGFNRLKDAYNTLTGDRSLREVAYQKKRQVIRELFPSELRQLTAVLAALLERLEEKGELAEDDIAALLVELTACLPIYRTYFADSPGSSADPYNIQVAAEETRRRNPHVAETTIALVERLILDHVRLDAESERLRGEFVSRWQQFTGPAMAKGFEDTALYDWFPLASVNDVGAPHEPGAASLQTYHTWNTTRAGRYEGLNATSTHDTKRSEDVRARLNVLSETPDAWLDWLERWHSANKRLKDAVEGEPVPDAAFESFIYQNLLGIWDDALPVATICDRLKQYVTKAARERKRHTSWLDVQPDYEAALTTFVDRLFDPSANGLFLEDLHAFCGTLVPWGRLNSVVQALVKAAAPGVPDFYQGAELYDFSLVDPDNRRPVDFERRRQLLEECSGLTSPPVTGLGWMTDGAAAERLRFWVTWRSLGARRELAELFTVGRYEGLYASGHMREHILAFSRSRGDTWAVAIGPRFARTLHGDDVPGDSLPWGQAALDLPQEAPRHWTNVLTGASVESDSSGQLGLDHCLSQLPVALLVHKPA